MATICITRPIDNAQRFAEDCAAIGWECLIAPAMQIRPASLAESQLEDIANTSIDGIIISSRHAVALLARFPTLLARPLYCVGEYSAHMLRDVGANNIVIAAPSMNELLTKIEHADTPTSLLYMRGEHIAQNIAHILGKKGYNIREIISYHADAVEKWDNNVVTQWKNNTPSAIALFSSRSAVLTETLIRHQGLADYCKNITAYCLSPSIASALTLAWKTVHISQTPSHEAMMQLLSDHSPSQNSGKTHIKGYNRSMNDNDSTHSSGVNSTATSGDHHEEKSISWIGTIVVILALAVGAYFFGRGELPDFLNLQTQSVKTSKAPNLVITERNESATNTLQKGNSPAFEHEVADIEDVISTHHAYLSQKLPAILKNTEERMKALEERITRLERREIQTSQASDTKLAKELRALKEQFSSLQPDTELQSMTLASTKSLKQMVAFNRLSRSVLSNEPFTLPLEQFVATLEEESPIHSIVGSLTVFSQTGLPNASEKKAMFFSALEVAHKSLENANVAQDNASMLDGIGRSLSDLVQIRKVGAAHSGSDAASVLARLRAAYEENAPSSEIDKLLVMLDSPVQELFEKWRNAERNTTEIHASLTTIHDAIIDQLEVGRPDTEEEPATIEDTSNTAESDKTITSDSTD